MMARVTYDASGFKGGWDVTTCFLWLILTYIFQFQTTVRTIVLFTAVFADFASVRRVGLRFFDQTVD